MQSYDSDGYLAKIQNLFWLSFNRIVSYLRKSNEQNSSKLKTSNQISLESESSLDYISHFLILLNNDVATSIRSFYVNICRRIKLSWKYSVIEERVLIFIQDQSQQIQASNYLDPSYQLLKSLIKDIVDHNQGVGQSIFQKLTMPIQLLCMIIGNSQLAFNNSLCSQISSTNSFQMMNNSNSSNKSTSTMSQKILIDILIQLWESYFCKHLVSVLENEELDLEGSYESWLDLRTPHLL